MLSTIASRLLRTTLLLAAMTTASAAFAHAHLKDHTPASDSVVESSPQRLVLNFSEALEAKFSGVRLTGPQHNVIAIGPAQVNASDSKQLEVPVTQPLTPGKYNVEWHVVSVDGHKTQGQYTFSVK